MPFSRPVLGFEVPHVPSAYAQTPEPIMREEAGAAFRQQSIEYATYSLLARQYQFDVDPDFFVGDYVRENYPNLRADPDYYPLARAQSEKEFFAIKQRIDQERKDKEVLGRAGMSGLAWQIVAGVLSPTLLIPLVGVSAKGAQALKQGVALGALATGIDETLIQLSQESRSWEESAITIGAGAFLGGVLGGAIGAVRANRAAYSALVTKFEEDLVAQELTEGVSVALPKVGQASTVGAKAAIEAPTGTVGLFGITEGTFSKFGVGKYSIEQLGPVTRGLNQIFFNARYITAQISDAGLRLKGLPQGSVAAPGGAVAELRKGWNYNLIEGLRGYDEAWAKYVFDDAPPQVFTGARAFVRSQLSREKLTKSQFDLAVSRYMRGSDNWTEGLDEKAKAAVKTAGDVMEQKVYTPIFNRMKELGMLPENIKTVGDTKYLNRIYDVQKILKNPGRFVSILEDHFRKKRAASLEAEIKKLNEQMIKAKVAEEDQTLPAQWAEKRRAVLQEQLKLLKTQSPEVSAALDELVTLRKLARKAKKEGDQSLVEQYLSAIKMLKERYAKELKTYRKQTGEINERLRNLDRNIELLEDQRSKKMIEIDRILDQQSKTFERVSSRYMSFTKRIQRYSKPALEKEYNHVSKLLDDAIKGYERAETRAQKLLDADNGDVAKVLAVYTRDKLFGRLERLQKLRTRLEEAKKTLDNSDEIVKQFQSEWKHIVEAARDLNNGRALIIARLREQAELLDPKIVQAALNERRAELNVRRQDLRERLRQRGFDEVELGDVEQKVLDFTTNERLKEFYARWFERDPAAVDLFRDVTNLSIVKAFTNIKSPASDITSPGFHEAMVGIKTSNDALKWISENSVDESYRIIARRLLGNADVEIIQVRPGDILPDGDSFSDDAVGSYLPMDRQSTRSVHETSFIIVPHSPFVSESTLLHEIIHAGSANKIVQSPALTKKFLDYRNAIIREIMNLSPNNSLDGITSQELEFAISRWYSRKKLSFSNRLHTESELLYFLIGSDELSDNNVRELITVGLSNPDIANILKQIKLPGLQPIGQNAWDWFVGQLGKLFGFAREEGTALGRLLELADETFDSQLPLEKVSKLSYFDPRRPTWVDNGARDVAESVMNKIVGDPLRRLQSYDWLAAELRDAELERTLDIASQAVEDFLDNNPERLARAYVRTLAPDMELFGKFGSVTAKDQLAALRAEYITMRNAALDEDVKKQMIEELEAQLARTTDEADQKKINFRLEALRSKMDPVDIHKAYERAVEDIQAMIGRLRHTWGVPQNPAGWGARLARIFMELNTLRLMGMVLPSSVADTGRFTAKYGLTNVFKNGLIPMIKNFKQFKLSAREAQLAGTANDVFLHTRMYEMMDLVEEAGARSKFESALDMMTSKIGIVGLFDYWNTVMKMFGAAMTNAEILDSIQTLIDVTHRGAKTPKETAEFLASLNIDSFAAEDIWRLVTAGGGGRHNGVWLPETEKWLEVAESVGMTQERARFLQRLYRAALAREVDSMIVTTGVDRSLWMDRTLAGRIISQFKSFILTSTFQVLMAGLQGRNANFAISAAISLAMGALSYKLWMISVYGPNPDNHPDVGWEKWADEMIDRSGLLGVFAEVRNIATGVPWLADAVTFSGAPPTRFGGVGAVGKMLGPSADLMETSIRVLAGLEEPTEQWLRQVRKLAPYQNVWWARHTIFDPLVQAAGLPEKRSVRND